MGGTPVGGCQNTLAVAVPSTKQGPLFRIAHHEAGHLLVGAALIRIPFEVSVVPEIDTGGMRLGGHVAFRDPRQFDGRLEGGLPDRRSAIATLWTACPASTFGGSVERCASAGCELQNYSTSIGPELN